MESSKLDMLFINVGSSKKKIYQDLSRDFSAIEPPFWAALTAGFIRKKGFKINILDSNAENLTHEETSEYIEEKNPSFVNIIVYGQHPSASTQLMTDVGDLCVEIKKKNPNRKIILSGLHPSALPAQTLFEEKCDFVIQGEGFYSILGFLEKKPPQEIPGLWYFQENQIKQNAPAGLILNLDEELSDIAWDILPMEKYKAHNWHCLHNLSSRKSYASISTSLGCPFNCSFCCINAPFGRPSYRTWSPEWVLKQIDILVKNYGVKNIKFIDELFVLKPEHFKTIAQGLVERNYGLNIWVYARVDTINEEDLNLLKKAGMNWFALGIESGDDSVRDVVSKGRFDKEDIRKIVGTIKKHGINVGGNFIFGLPEDTYESMQKTLDLAIELNCEWVNFYCATAYPGSMLYDEALSKNLPLPKKWRDYAQHCYSFIPLPTKTLTSKQVLEFRDKAFNIYFKGNRYLDMVEKKFGVESRRHLEEMTKINLKRELFAESKKEN